MGDLRNNPTPAVKTGVAQSATATPAAVKPVGPDFCLVELTAAGVTAAGDHSLRYSNGRQQFVFQPGEPVKVARYEWDLALSGHTTANGQPLFEIYVAPSNAISLAADKIPGTVETSAGPEIPAKAASTTTSAAEENK
jgi:hypothetical protein